MQISQIYGKPILNKTSKPGWCNLLRVKCGGPAVFKVIVMCCTVIISLQLKL